MFNSKKRVRTNDLKNQTDIYDERYARDITPRTFSSINFNRQATPIATSTGDYGDTSTGLTAGLGISITQNNINAYSVANSGVRTIEGCSGAVDLTSVDKSVTITPDVGKGTIDLAAAGGGTKHSIFSTTHQDTFVDTSVNNGDWISREGGNWQNMHSASADENKSLVCTNIGANYALRLSTLPIAGGGTGSSTQNFVDLTTDQTIKGTKRFQDDAFIVEQDAVTGNDPALAMLCNKGYSDYFQMYVTSIPAFEIEAGKLGGTSVAITAYGDLNIGTLHGNMGFGGVAYGATPTADAHLATKKYVDDYIPPKTAINNWNYHVSLTSSMNNLLSNQVVAGDGSIAINKAPDVPRNICVSVLSNNNPLYKGTISLSGTDCNGNTANYTLTFNIARGAAQSFSVPIAFVKLGTAKITSTTGLAKMLVINVGWWNSVGVGNFPFTSSTQNLHAKEYNATTTFTFDTTYGTYKPSVTTTAGDIFTFIVKSG